MVMEQLRIQNMGIEPPREMADVLSMESDGQISLVVPESEKVEKQITGQMRIEDILTEWERMKRDNEEKRREAIHQKVLRQTGPMFTAFEESIRDGLLEQLEQGIVPEELAEEADSTAAYADEEELATQENPLEEEGIVTEEETQEEEEYAAEEETQEEEEYAAGEETQEEEEYAAEEETQEEEEYAAEEETQEEGYAVEADIPEETAYAIEGDNLNEEVYSDEEDYFTEEDTAEELEEIEEDTAEEPEEIEEDTAGEEEYPAEDDAAEAESGGKPETGESRPSRERPRVRALTREEKELYGTFIQSKSSKEKLITAIDSISLASYTGNVVITGDEGMDTLTLAKNMIREVQMTDSNFSGKIAKISGSSLNQRDIAKTLDGLANGALIIQKASDINENTADILHRALQQEQYGLIVIMEDTRKAMNKFLGAYPKLAECFNARVDMEALSNDSLVAFGKKYAREREYSIDELGILALHTRIAEMQTSDHAVTILDVKEILDEAIRHADRKSIGHFVDILLAKRYDEEDMIILRENDFIR